MNVIRPILVVDDSRAHRRLLTRTLEKWGYETAEAESAESALAYLAGNEVDLVISDWIMPGMSGVEFCQAFRDLISERPAYFVLLTANTEREFLAEGLESGADDFLTKPFSTVELRARLRAGVRVIQSQRELADKNAALSSTLEELSGAYSAIQRDLNGARKFQESLVPERHFESGCISLSLLFRPSGQVGGDLVGYFPVNANEIGCFSIDVSGHGVASALMTARVASYLGDARDRNVAMVRAGDAYRIRHLPDVCETLNSLLQSDAETDQYLTLSIAKVNPRSGVVEICQAGHPSPAIQRISGDVEYREMLSTPIGLIDDGEFVTETIELSPGDRILLYSDGLTECPDPGDAMLDEDGLAAILKDHSALRGLALIDAVVDDLETFRGGQDFPDDLSAIVIERGLSPG